MSCNTSDVDPLTLIGCLTIQFEAIESDGKLESAIIIASPCPNFARTYSNSGLILVGIPFRGIVIYTNELVMITITY